MKASASKKMFRALTLASKINSIMSLLNLVHKNVIIKFTDSSKSQFDPAAAYVFRLTGVDGMGFLLIQDLKPGSDTGHETASEPYWINKDFVRELHELNLENGKGTLYSNGQATKSQPKPPIDPIRRDVTPKPAKAKAAAKQMPDVN